MQLFGYQHAGFLGTLVEIQAVPTEGPCTLLGLPQAKKSDVLRFVRAIVSPLPHLLIKLDGSFDKEGCMASLALTLLVYQKQMLSLQLPPVLVYATLDVYGNLKAFPSLRDAPRLCKERGIPCVLLGGEENQEPFLKDGITWIACKDVSSATTALLRFGSTFQALNRENLHPESCESWHDPFTTIVGLEEAKLALLYAVIGQLPLLFYGPPGAGKTLLLNSTHYLLPPLQGTEMEEAAAIHGRRLEHPPVCTILPSMTQAELAKGRIPYICKAHGGALLVDELSHQKPSVRAFLSQLMDTQSVLSYPVHCCILSATNACPCGNLGSPSSICRCSEQQIDRYWALLGHALLDRFALIVRVQPENLLVAKLTNSPIDRARIEQARQITQKRQENDYHVLLPRYTKVASYRQGSLRRALLCCKLAQVIADYQGKISVTQEIMEEAYRLYLLPQDCHYR